MTPILSNYNDDHVAQILWVKMIDMAQILLIYTLQKQCFFVKQYQGDMFCEFVEKTH